MSTVAVEVAEYGTQWDRGGLKSTADLWTFCRMRIRCPGYTTWKSSTNIPEIDIQYVKKSETLDFLYPPNAKARNHCARIIFDAIGQPDQILMKRTNSGYEVCEIIIVDRYCEIFNTKEWKKPPQSFVYPPKEFEEVESRQYNQPSIMEVSRTLYTLKWNNNDPDPSYADLSYVPYNIPPSTMGICHGSHWLVVFYSC
nr:hypothetical transcript [Hymenolepis microstoma]